MNCYTTYLYEMSVEKDSPLEKILEENFTKGTDTYRFLIKENNIKETFETLNISVPGDNSEGFEPDRILEALRDQGLIWVSLKTLDFSDGDDPFNYDVSFTLAALNKVGLVETRFPTTRDMLKDIRDSY